MELETTPKPPALETGQANLESLKHQFANKLLSPLVNRRYAEVKLEATGTLHRLLFANGVLTVIGKKILKAAFQKTLEDITARFPTFQAFSSLMENPLAIDMIDLLMRAHLDAIAGQEALREQSGYDGLMNGFIQKNNTSGLYQRVIHQILQRTRENNQNLSLALIDIDNFKGVNNYGQHVGDAALTHIATIIIANSRAQTTFIRWGGEEIVLIFENCSPADAAEAVSRINLALNQHPLYLIADLKEAGRQEVGAIYQLEKSRYEELKSLGIEQIERRATETTLVDPRGNSVDKKVRLLGIPLSASIGVSSVKSTEPAAIDEAVVEANSLERFAKENGRNQVWYQSSSGQMIRF